MAVDGVTFARASLMTYLGEFGTWTHGNKNTYIYIYIYALTKPQFGFCPTEFPKLCSINHNFPSYKSNLIKREKFKFMQEGNGPDGVVCIHLFSSKDADIWFFKRRENVEQK